MARRSSLPAIAQAYEGKLSKEDEERLKIDKQYFMEIYTADADGSNVKRLTDAPGYDGGPFFSADGQRICWRRFTPKGDVAEVWTMNADGSDQKAITKLGAMSWAPYFHPSGEYLIFTTNLNGFANFELYIVDAAGKHAPVRVTTTDGFDGLPVFTPDGKKLSWTSGRCQRRPEPDLHGGLGSRSCAGGVGTGSRGQGRQGGQNT
jgi:Tol biopolymer transport system component